MFEVKFNKEQFIVFKTVFGLSLVLLSFTACFAAYAGPQSLLDPYAEVQPTKVKSDSKKPLIKKIVKQPKQQAADLESAPVSRDENTSSEIASESPAKMKASKAAIAESGTAGNGGFLSGVKEIQHGYVTSIKAAGSGIINGSKVAGAKVASGTRALGGGMAAASSKVIAKPKALVAKKMPVNKTKRERQLANAGSMSSSMKFPSLPGKPLDQAVAQEKTRKKLKDTPVTGEVKKPGIISNAVNKLNFFHREKKTPAVNIAAHNPEATH